MKPEEDISVFHEGEQAIQAKVGVKDQIGAKAQQFIRTYMPEQHREFFTALPHIHAGFVDDKGQPWATIGFGDVGFITSPDAKHLHIKTEFALNKALNLQCATGDKIGLLGLDPTNRRRNRMNGVIESNTDDTLAVSVEQSYGNCPQYIQTYATNHSGNDDTTRIVADTAITSAAMQGIISDARTFFIASRAATLSTQSRHGIDVSHRGGKQGFVKVLDDNKLIFPDFSGNRFYNTLGNINQDSRVGLQFPDYNSGKLLFVSGNANILWSDETDYEFKGAERFIEVTITRAVLAAGGMPIQSELLEESPWLRRTGQWTQA